MIALHSPTGHQKPDFQLAMQRKSQEMRRNGFRKHGYSSPVSREKREFGLIFPVSDEHVSRDETAWRRGRDSRTAKTCKSLGNHDLHGDEKTALSNYFRRFPDLKNSRYYSVRAANTIVLTLDSSLDESSGPQGRWLVQRLGHVPGDVDFVFIVLHHPPYTSSSDARKFGGGHSARPQEQALAKMLESRQQNLRARIVVFSGHVHNYERHEHGGVLYFVTGGAGAHAYPIERAPDDPFQSTEVNYHYLLVEVSRGNLKITMHRLDLTTGKAVWTEPDSIAISVHEKKALASRQ